MKYYKDDMEISIWRKNKNKLEFLMAKGWVKSCLPNSSTLIPITAKEAKAIRPEGFK